MSGWELLQGDACERLAEMGEESVQTCITSPPYYGLRDYGNEGQIGLESTPDEYVANLVAVFREVKRVLRDDGTLWLNLGDSYAGSGKGPSNGASKQASNVGSLITPGALISRNPAQFAAGQAPTTWLPVPFGCKAKDLIGIPWMVAFTLRADGWYLRSEIIWAKPNPMPESVTDRPTKAHEQVFLLSKSARYYYDAEAIREMNEHPNRSGTNPRLAISTQPGNTFQIRDGERGGIDSNPDGRNKRSVWTVATQPYPDAHFATFPPKLIEPMVLAGSHRVDDVVEPALILTPTGERNGDDPTMQAGRKGMNRPRGVGEGRRPITVHEQRQYARQLRDSPHLDVMRAEAGDAFDHYCRTDESGARPIPERLLSDWTERGWLTVVKRPKATRVYESQATILDPFAGSGTTLQVAIANGRAAVGVELNPAYCALAERRLAGVTPSMFDAVVA